MKRFSWLVPAVLAWGLATAWLAREVEVYALRLPWRGEALAWVGPAVGEISLSYLHSVERSEVRGVFRAEGGRLVLVETHYRSPGSGLPVDRPAVRQGDWWVVAHGHPLDGFRMNLAPVNEPRLIVAGRFVPLPLPEGNQALRLAVERPARWRWLAWLWLGWAWSTGG